MSDSGLISVEGQIPANPFAIDDGLQDRLNDKLTLKILHYEAELKRLSGTTSPEDRKALGDVREKLDALKKADRRPASVRLPKLETRSPDLEKKRSGYFQDWRSSLSPRSEKKRPSPRVPHSARDTSEAMQKRNRYEHLMAVRGPLVEQLRTVDKELATLSRDLGLPPPKPPASIPSTLPQVRAKSQGALPPAPL